MFFFRYAKNRYFKPKSNSSGQIFPFLLVCLAGLLVAAIVTIGVGESAKAKTHTSNAADAGSLAAASSWAAAFNKLVDRNKDVANTLEDNFGQYLSKDDTYQYYKRMKFYYNQMRARYQVLYDQGNQYLTNKPNDNALYWSQEAERLAREALAVINTPIIDNNLWAVILARVDELNAQAAAAAWEAANCIGAFGVLGNYMQAITDSFKNYQIGNFLDAKYFMDNAYEKSRKTGLSYVFSNSGTSSRVPNGDDFNFWLGAGRFYDKEFNTENKFYDPDINSATYKWEIGTTKCGVGKCGITATLSLPKIKSYLIKHSKLNYPTKKTLYRVAIPCLSIAADPIKSPSENNPDYPDDPFNTAATNQLVNDMGKISEHLSTSLLSQMQAIFNKTVDGVNCFNKNHHRCDQYQSCNSPPEPGCDPLECIHWVDDCPNSVNFFNEARTMQAELAALQNCIVTGLNTINTSLENNLTIPTLKKGNMDIFENVWPDPDSGQVSSSEVATVIDVWGYDPTPPPPPAPAPPYQPELGMMVINIESVTLDPAVWTTGCTVSTFCNNLLNFRNGECINPITTSGSTSGFDGGNIGEFEDEYYSRIISVN